MYCDVDISKLVEKIKSMESEAIFLKNQNKKLSDYYNSSKGALTHKNNSSSLKRVIDEKIEDLWLGDY